MGDRFLAIVRYRYAMSSLFEQSGRQTLVDNVVFRQQYVNRVTLSDAAFGSTSFIGGLQVAPEAMMLGGTAVPAGSVLVFNGQGSPDQVIAVSGSTGAVIATLVLDDYELTAGLYDSTSNTLRIVARNTGGTHRVLELDPMSGAVLSGFDLPFQTNEAGLALDPSGNGLWFASQNEHDLLHIYIA